jgi:hypothetical protein
MEIIFEAGRNWTIAELPRRSIALDGAVRGPVIDHARQVYSFDHHDHCIRHVTLSSCEQVRDALLVGLDPCNYRIYVNDVDADTVIAVWLLQHPERLRAGVQSERLLRMVQRIGRLDALGPAVGSSHPLLRVMPGPTEPRSRAVLDEALKQVERWWRKEGEIPQGPTEPPTIGLWVEGGAVLTKSVRHGFRQLYQWAPFGVLQWRAADGRYGYTIGKRSEFVEFDVRAFLDACNRAEFGRSDVQQGWGGGSTIGGAPRGSEGLASALSPELVAEILLQTAQRSTEQGPD